jgi:hypothetical protein
VDLLWVVLRVTLAVGGATLVVVLLARVFARALDL